MQVVYRPGTSAADAGGLARPSLLWRDGMGWDLYVSGLGGDRVWRVVRATTPGPAPLDFRPAGPVLEPGPPLPGDPVVEVGVRSPCATATADGGVLLLHAADDGQRSHLRSAWLPATPTGLLAPEWQRLGTVLAAGEPGAADAAGCDHPALLALSGMRRLYYTALDGTMRGGAQVAEGGSACGGAQVAEGGSAPGGRIALATGRAGEPWTRHGVVIGLGEPGQPDAAGARAPAVAVVGATVLLHHTAQAEDGALRILAARSDDGFSFERLGPVTPVGWMDPAVAAGGDGQRWLAAVVDGAVVVERLGSGRVVGPQAGRRPVGRVVRALVRPDPLRIGWV